MTHLIAFENAFTTAAEHFSWSAVSGTQPVSSDAQVGVSVAQPPEQLLFGSPLLKHCPGPGGVCANAPPAPRKKMPPIASPRIRFMSPPPLGLVRLFAAAATVPFCRGVITQTNGDCQGEKKIGRKKKWARRPPSKRGSCKRSLVSPRRSAAIATRGCENSTTRTGWDSAPYPAPADGHCPSDNR